MTNKELSPRAVEARRVYMRRWKQHNPEQHKANEKNFWEKYADKLEAEQIKQR